MKIAFFTDTFLPQLNGVATSVSNFYKELKKINPDIKVIAPKIKNYHDTDKNIIRLSSSKAWPTLPDSARIPLPLNKEWAGILRNDYQIIHAHGNGLFSLLALIIARQKKIPFVLTFHTFWEQYNHYILGGKILTPKMINKLLSTFASKCNSIITPSEKMKQLLINSGVKKPISVIPNFVDLDKFKNATNGFLYNLLNIKKNQKILLSVGRLGKEKNFAFLINMFSLLNLQNENTHLVIVGEGMEKKNLEKQIRQLNLQNFIHLTGPIPVQSMPKVYKDADIFVFASQSEVHPMVAIEAAASSLPLIVVDDSAYDGVVDDTVNGFRTPLNPKEFGKKVLTLLKDSQLRNHMSEKSREIISKHFVKEKIIKQLMEIYTNLLNKNSSLKN